MTAKFLSLILPAYKQEKTILVDLKSIDKALSALNIKYEIIVVVDGFVDGTYQIAKSIEQRTDKNNQSSTIKDQRSGSIKVLGYEKNEGKGFAIKHGIQKARGDIIGFIDAGMDLAPSEISMMLSIMDWNNADIVIGSKLHPDSIVNYPRSRKILSWGYRTIIKILFRLNIKDSQVGLKIFRGEVAKKVFPKIVVKKFAFDIEVLAVAQSMGFAKIYEAPIKIKFRPGSITAVNFWKVSFWTLWDTLAVFYRMHFLHYYDKKNSL